MVRGYQNPALLRNMFQALDAESKEQMREASDQLVKLRAVFNPRAERKMVYDELYDAYRSYGSPLGL